LHLFALRITYIRFANYIYSIWISFIRIANNIYIRIANLIYSHCELHIFPLRFANFILVFHINFIYSYCELQIWNTCVNLNDFCLLAFITWLGKKFTLYESITVDFSIFTKLWPRQLGTINTRSSSWLETGQSNSTEFPIKLSKFVMKSRTKFASKFANCKRFWR
jgi:hypothetical protein